VSNGRAPDDLFVLGDPSSIINSESKKLLTETMEEEINRWRRNKIILFLHQSMAPRYSTRKWETDFYRDAVSDIILNGFQVLFKFHPRFATKENIENLRAVIEEKIGRESVKKNIIFVDRNVTSESLESFVDAGVTSWSAGSFMIMRNQKPVYFYPPQFNAPRIFDDAHVRESGFVFDSIDDLVNGISNDFINTETIGKAVNRTNQLMNLLAGPKDFEVNFVNYIESQVLKDGGITSDQ